MKPTRGEERREASLDEEQAEGKKKKSRHRPSFMKTCGKENICRKAERKAAYDLFSSSLGA